MVVSLGTVPMTPAVYPTGKTGAPTAALSIRKMAALGTVPCCQRQVF
jgi:hypothetical protein